MTNVIAPRAREIVREPSVDAFTEYAARYDELTGKFIRMGGVILVAPVVKLGTGRVIKHLDILWAGFETSDEELARRIDTETENADEAGRAETVTVMRNYVPDLAVDVRSM